MPWAASPSWRSILLPCRRIYPTNFLQRSSAVAAETAKRAGVAIAGGHTVQDKEPKFGLVVIGFVHPQHILTKGGMLPGDRLYLTKPLGFGVTTTALKRQIASDEDVREVVGWMTKLNREAGQLASELELRGGTDVTGFSLLGHAMEMADASGLGCVLNSPAFPSSPAPVNTLNNGPSLAAQPTTIYTLARASLLLKALTKPTRCCCLIRKPAAACCWPSRRKKWRSLKPGQLQ